MSQLLILAAEYFLQRGIAYLLSILAGQGDIREVAGVSEISEGRGGRLLKLVPTEAHPITGHPCAVTFER